MPLNNSHLSLSMVDANRGLLYETQVQIYHKKCAGCGFVSVEARTGTAPKSKLLESFNDIDKAIRFAEDGEVYLHHKCCYPDQEEPYTLTEIISNTCEFWNTDKLDIPSNEETDFIEIENMEALNEQYPNGQQAA